MKVLIFGNSGLVGKELESFLKSRGYETIGVSRRGESDYNFNISEYPEFKQIKENPDFIINCASILPHNQYAFEEKYLRNLFEVNVLGGVNIIKWALEKGVKKIINFSSLSINERPWRVPLNENSSGLVSGKHTAYAMSKLCQEKMMTELDLEKKLDIIHLRLSAVYGDCMKKEGIIFYLQKFIDENKNIDIINGNKNSFDFIKTTDINAVVEQVLHSNIPRGTYNLASGEEVKLIELAEILLKINKYDVEINNSETEMKPSRSVVNLTKIKQYLNDDFKFIKLEEGLKTLLIN